MALNGVELANSAPTHAILGAHTLAPFDDCGGHINLHEGYHYHAVTSGCLAEVAQPDGHAGLIGYAMDGFAIHAMTGPDGAEPTDLDECRGHTDGVRGYHYHASGAGMNQILSCFAGEAPSASGPGGRPGGGPPGGGPPGGVPPDGGPPGGAPAAGGAAEVGAPGGAPTGAAVAAFTASQTSRCCGDGTCDGPETSANCAQDCK